MINKIVEQTITVTIAGVITYIIIKLMEKK